MNMHLGRVWCLIWTFSSVQSLSRVQLIAPPWTTACQASLSITNSRSPPKPMSIESVMPSNHLILCRPLLLLPSIPPSIRVFSNESALRMRWPKHWSFSFNISPSNEHPGLISFRMDWLDLFAAQGTLKNLLQHYSSKASFWTLRPKFNTLVSTDYSQGPHATTFTFKHRRKPKLREVTSHTLMIHPRWLEITYTDDPPTLAGHYIHWWPTHAGWTSHTLMTHPCWLDITHTDDPPTLAGLWDLSASMRDLTGAPGRGSMES